jgi:DNA polymerase III sliding clamp (beta) subunit (PCNA family)
MTTLKLLSAADLKNRFKKMIPFMSTEDTRHYLKGVYFEYENNTLKATATNGHILCNMEWQLTESVGEDFNVIVPAHAVKHLVKIITAKNAEDGGVLLHFDGTEITFTFTDFSYQTKAVDGAYPDYSQFLPKGKDRLQTGLNASYLIDVLKALSNSPVDISVDDSENAASQPHLFASKDEDGVRCVIMPMRT